MGTKKGRIFGKGAPFKGAPRGLGEQLPQTPPPGSATARKQRTVLWETTQCHCHVTIWYHSPQ